MEQNYYHQKLNVPVVSWVGKRLELQFLGNEEFLGKPRK